MIEDVAWLRVGVGEQTLDKALLAFAEHFPAVAVYRGHERAAEWLAASTEGIPHRAVALEELMMLWLANLNPGFRSFKELIDDKELAARAYAKITAALWGYF